MPIARPMIAHSILDPDSSKHSRQETPQPPNCFPDLNLDQLVESITAGRDQYQLPPIFYTPPEDIDIIHYRQQVILDVDRIE